MAADATSGPTGPHVSAATPPADEARGRLRGPDLAPAPADACNLACAPWSPSGRTAAADRLLPGCADRLPTRVTLAAELGAPAAGREPRADRELADLD